MTRLTTCSMALKNTLTKRKPNAPNVTVRSAVRIHDSHDSQAGNEIPEIQLHNWAKPVRANPTVNKMTAAKIKPTKTFSAVNPKCSLILSSTGPSPMSISTSRNSSLG